MRVLLHLDDVNKYAYDVGLKIYTSESFLYSTGR